ncbi:MAG TPA: hypothetical protein VH593_14915, partial [Ktedonobacteraceae bacterium]
QRGIIRWGKLSQSMLRGAISLKRQLGKHGKRQGETYREQQHLKEASLLEKLNKAREAVDIYALWNHTNI